MALLKRRLTKSVLDILVVEPGRRQSLYWDPDLKGFGVLVSSSGAKTFVVKRRNVRMAIDRTYVISVDEARQRAIEALAVIGRGENPIQVRRERSTAERAAKQRDFTVGEVWEAYRVAKKQLRPKTLEEYQYELTTYCAAWLALPLRDLTRTFVAAEHTRIREQVAAGKRSKLVSGNSTANGVMRLVRALWNFAEANELVPELGKNPVRALSLNHAWYPEPPRERFIPEAQLPTFYAAINGYRSPFLDDPWAYRDLIRLMLFTGLRRGEAMRLRWESVDFVAGMIRLRADQTKSKRRLDLPMSSYVAQLMKQRFEARGTGNSIGPRQWVFPGERSHVSDPRHALVSAAKALANAAEQEDWLPFFYNPHSLRRTFVTVAESCDLSAYALKALVNHSFGDDVTAIYIGRNDERLRIAAQKVSDRMTLLCRPKLTLATNESVA